MGATASLIQGPQSVVVQEGDETYGDIRRYVGSPDELVATFHPDIATMYDTFAHAVKTSPEKPFLGTRNGEAYTWVTYAQAMETVKALGSGLVSLGCEPGTKIGIYASNCPGWTLTGQACNAYSLTSVALYDTLGPDACQYIVNQAEIPVAVVAEKHVATLLATAAECPQLKTFVQISGNISAENKKAAEAAGVTLHSFDEVVKLGQSEPVEVRPPSPEDLAFLCYTSGTTGNPKGVMLSHGNMVADLAGAFIGGLELEEDEVHVSYLPLAHVFERVVQEAIIYHRGAIGFYSGDITKLMEDIAVLQPTLFPSVPRLFNRLYDKVSGAVAAKGGIAASLFGTALEAKKEGLKEGYYTHAVWDRIVFGKVRARLGGRVKYMVTGSAPLSAEVMEFLRCCFSCPVLEGYGQTECAAACTLTARNDMNLGHVGAPLACNEIRLESIPEMSYTVTDKPYPRGEVCIRGPNVCQGYYKMPEKTAETIDEDGWLHTGDVGTWLPNGTLKIIDRKKNIFKLAQGEYVAPEKIENVYSRCPHVAQTFIYGNSLKASLIGVIVPDFEVLTPWAKENGLASISEDPQALCKDEKVRDLILSGVKAVGKESGLHGFEQIRGLILHHEPFSTENGILTPTFKMKRPQAYQAFQEEIDALNETLQ